MMLEMQAKPDLIFRNYSDGNLVATLLVHKLGVTQSKDNVKLGVVKNVQTTSSPDFHVSEPKSIPCHSEKNQLAENAAPALDRIDYVRVVNYWTRFWPTNLEMRDSDPEATLEADWKASESFLNQGTQHLERYEMSQHT